MEEIISKIDGVQIIKKDQINVIEVNPRASRTVPFISKSIGVPLANIATKIMLGKKLVDFKLKKKNNLRKNVVLMPFFFDFRPSGLAVTRFSGDDI